MVSSRLSNSSLPVTVYQRDNTDFLFNINLSYINNLVYKGSEEFMKRYKIENTCYGACPDEEMFCPHCGACIEYTSGYSTNYFCPACGKRLPEIEEE